MARITVEDCLKHVDNRFNLVLLAAKRARLLSRDKGRAEPLVNPEGDKPTVIALREIGAGLLTQAHVEMEEDIDLERSAELALAQRPVVEIRPFDD